jgi:hypothetical protein
MTALGVCSAFLKDRRRFKIYHGCVKAWRLTNLKRKALITPRLAKDRRGFRRGDKRRERLATVERVIRPKDNYLFLSLL